MRTQQLISHLLLTSILSGALLSGFVPVKADTSSSVLSKNDALSDLRLSQKPVLRENFSDSGITWFNEQLSRENTVQIDEPKYASLSGNIYNTLPLTQTQDADPALLDTLEEEETILFEADQITRASLDSPLIAEGSVRAFFGERYLTAQKLVFYPDTNVVIAEGQVSITEANQETVFAERVELSGDLRDGIAENFTALLDENARVAADTALREQGARTRLNRVVYTACDVCKDNGDTKTPTWRIKSLRVTRDEERRVIRFRHAFLELKGVPVFYTPFIQAPDPSVERQSGFLTPLIGTSSRLSPFLEVPYYFAVSNSLDFTFFPKFTLDDGTLWQGEFRRAGRNSFHVWAGGVIDFDRPQVCGNGAGVLTNSSLCTTNSRALLDPVTGENLFFTDPVSLQSTLLTLPDDEDVPVDAPGVRWYYFGRGYHNVTNNWRVGYDIERVSDDAFLRLYDVQRRGDLRLEFDRSRTNRLRSNINTAWTKGGSSFTADSYLFQGLRGSDDSTETPLVLPILNFRHDFRYRPAGGKLFVNANFVSLQRTGGIDSGRLTTQAFWNKEYISRGGHRFNAFGELRGDAFFFQDLDEGTEILAADPTIAPEDTSDVVGRFAPTVGVEWSYPVAKNTGNARLFLEPKVQLIASLNNRNPASIINEDSQSIEFDYSGLFDYNKSTGFDAVEDGQRLNAGLHGSVQWNNGISLSGSIGRQFRIQDTNAFQFTSGLGNETSDFVGELDFELGRTLSLQNRFRFDDSGDFDRIESVLGVNIGRLNGTVSYTLLEEEDLGTASDGTDIGLELAEEEINALARLRLTRHWSIGAAWREDLRPDPITTIAADGSSFTTSGEGTIRQDFLIGYQDECSSFDIILRRDRTRDIGVGLPPDTSVLIRFTLRSLTSTGFGTQQRR